MILLRELKLNETLFSELCGSNLRINLIYFYTNVIIFLVSYKRKLFNNCISFRHSDTKVAAKNGKSFLASEDDMADVYPLQLRLSVMRETNSLGVKISKKVSSIY